jgi:hypothetical protein
MRNTVGVEPPTPALGEKNRPHAGGKEFHVKRFLLFFVLASFMLAGCSRSAATGTPYRVPISETLTPTQSGTAAPAAVAQRTASPTPGPAATKTPGPQAPTATPVAVASKTPTETAPAEAVEESACSLKDHGVQIDFGKTPDKDGFYVLSGSMKELEPYAGCNFLVEGRIELIEEHHIWLFRGPSWTLKIREGSLWVYPRDWNMDDWSAKKLPISGEFVVAKRHNQNANGYDWAIIVHTSTGNLVTFPAGSDLPAVVLPNNADFSAPELIEVHGVWDGSQFNASIGGEKTVTVALLDGTLYWWKNAKDNVLYKSVEAYTMPSSWSQDQVEAWAEEMFPAMELLPYKASAD